MRGRKREKRRGDFIKWMRKCRKPSLMQIIEKFCYTLFIRKVLFTNVLYSGLENFIKGKGMQQLKVPDFPGKGIRRIKFPI